VSTGGSNVGGGSPPTRTTLKRLTSRLVAPGLSLGGVVQAATAIYGRLGVRAKAEGRGVGAASDSMFESGSNKR
jgi:hypothetical protein